MLVEFVDANGDAVRDGCLRDKGGRRYEGYWCRRERYCARLGAVDQAIARVMVIAMIAAIGIVVGILVRRGRAVRRRRVMRGVGVVRGVRVLRRVRLRLDLLTLRMHGTHVHERLLADQQREHEHQYAVYHPRCAESANCRTLGLRSCPGSGSNRDALAGAGF